MVAEKAHHKMTKDNLASFVEAKLPHQISSYNHRNIPPLHTLHHHSIPRVSPKAGPTCHQQVGGISNLVSNPLKYIISGAAHRHAHGYQSARGPRRLSEGEGLDARQGKGWDGRHSNN